MSGLEGSPDVRGGNPWVGVRPLAGSRDRRINPAGMSYDRALEIAIDVLNRDVVPVDWFSADVIPRTPKTY